MKTPLTFDELEEAVFEAYENVKPETIAVLTLSVKFRIQLCVARHGLFVGDALDECCKRARMVFEAQTAIQPIPDNQIETTEMEEERETGRENEPANHLPSFRSVQ